MLLSVRFKYLPLLMRLLIRSDSRKDIVAMGRHHGVWRIPGDLLDASSVCYCVGVGDDTSFDEDLIQKYGCDVHAFDPRPKAVAHGRAVAARQPKFHFHEVGLWDQDTTLKFYVPANPAWSAYSVANLQGTDQHIECRVERLSTIMKRLGHTRLDLLKLDVEGAEYQVLSDLVRERIFPTVLAVEFDQPMPVRKTLAAVRELKASGYRLVLIDLWNYLFVRAEVADKYRSP